MSESLKITDISKTNIFKTPPHYFEQLPADILQKIKLAEGVRLQTLPRHHVFTVPPLYFEQLPQRIEQKIAISKGITLTQIAPHLVFTTPALYFEELTESIEQKIRLLEGKASPLLPKTQAFGTPDGYFDDLAAQIQQRVTTEKAGFWQKLKTPVLPRLALRYAGTFALILLMGFFALKMFDNTPLTANNSVGQVFEKHHLADNKIVNKLPETKAKKTNTANIERQNAVAQITPSPVAKLPATQELDLSSLSEKDVSEFLADVNPDELDVLDEVPEKDSEVETFLLNALESNKDLLFEQLKDIDLKAIQKSTLFRK